ncbi:MAG: polyprenyl synthetase family protein, partial [Dehalococcoidales bacterium]|nr:polyprenyl synthetase family protein [Dehalococcoidales bacterium]
TASLMACSVQVGALLGADDEETIRSLRSFGYQLGLAFQIRDDILGIWGDEKKTGKPVGADIRRRKKTFPIVYACEKAEGEARAALARVYQGKATVDPKMVDLVMSVLADLQAQEQAQRLVERYHGGAMAALEHANLSPLAHDTLAEVADFLTDRDY